jgi:hypothetical protein
MFVKLLYCQLWLLRIPNLEIFLFCQHNSTGGGNLELKQTIQLTKEENQKEKQCNFLSKVY